MFVCGCGCGCKTPPFTESLLIQDMLEYRKKQRPLRVRTLDGSVKTLLVDDSQTVAELTRAVCVRIGRPSTHDWLT